MSECKQCGNICEIRVSKSEKNPNKEYFACSNGCKVWNGWVNEPENTVTKKEYKSYPNAPMCKTCSTVCTQRESKTKKNFGKKFWACIKGCKVWNGWANESTQTKTAAAATPHKSTARQQIKRKAPIEIKKEKPTKMPKIPMISHHCVRCDKMLDIEHEIQNNIKRYSKFLDYPKELIYFNLKSELTEAITSGDYTCESCLGNE